MSDTTKTCSNPSCEDGWIGLRNLTAPPRPCLDCNPDAAHLVGPSNAKLKEFARWRDAPPHEIIADLSSRLEAARGEVARLTDERNYARTLATDRLLANNELTAEVDRLKGRDIAAAPLLRLVLDTTHMGDEWERDAEAWLAGCES